MNMNEPLPMDCGGADLERIKELTMKKIHSGRRCRRPVRYIAVAAALIAALGISVAAVGGHWGFADTSDMSRWEINRLLKEYNTVEFTQMVTPDGSVSYMQGGEVLFTLSAEEAAAYDEAKRESRRHEVRDINDKLDVDTMELFPNSVTEIAVDGEGGFGDFALKNGNLVLLCAGNGEAFELEAGDSVSISVSSGRPCYARFGIVKDGEVLEEVSLHASTLAHSFDIPTDGEYCFTLSYYSASADNFTEGKIVIK
ncbi:MAG: hypothetical protein IJY96_00410 [Oscillospiraceae bacterium]|nr:hypothetical protein [Oscillospiraceae bacterium]